MSGRPVTLISLGEGRKLFVDGRLGKSGDGEKWLAAPSGRPIESRSLRVGIDEQNSFLSARECIGDVNGERGLANTAFLVEETYDHGHLPELRFCGIAIYRVSPFLEMVKH